MSLTPSVLLMERAVGNNGTSCSRTEGMSDTGFDCAQAMGQNVTHAAAAAACTHITHHTSTHHHRIRSHVSMSICAIHGPNRNRNRNPISICNTNTNTNTHTHLVQHSCPSWVPQYWPAECPRHPAGTGAGAGCSQVKQSFCATVGPQRLPEKRGREE